jgi:hypothetical protein
VRIPIRTTSGLLGVLLATALSTAIAAPSADARAPRPTVPRPASWAPGVQAGRLELASEPGTYVDLGAPLTAREAADLAPYRAVRPAPVGAPEGGATPLPEALRGHRREAARGTRAGG